MSIINKISLSLYIKQVKKLQIKLFNGNVEQKRCVILSMLYIDIKREINMETL